MASSWVSIGYHEEELLFAIDVLRPDDLFIDVGANIGVYSMCALAVGAYSIAFEPVEAARSAFKANERLNKVAERSTLYPYALSDFDGTAEMTSWLESSNRFVEVTDTAEGTRVAVRTLDEVVAAGDQAQKSVSLLKVDAEGADEAVLRGARKLLERDRPSVIVEIWAGGLGVRRYLETLGYVIFHYDARIRALETVPMAFTADGYFIAIHPARLVQIATLVRLSNRTSKGPNVNWMPRDALRI